MAHRLSAILDLYADWPLGWVYAIHDQAGKIVYIGATEDLSERFAMHESGGSHIRDWLLANPHTYHCVSHHPTKRAMLDAERDAIELHRPMLNVRYHTMPAGPAPSLA